MAHLRSDPAYTAPLIAPTRSSPSDSDSDSAYNNTETKAPTKRPSYADALRKNLNSGTARPKNSGWLQLSKEDVRNLPSAPNGAPLLVPRGKEKKGWWEWLFGG